MISSIVVSPRAHVCHRDPLAPDQEPPDSSPATQGQVACRSTLSPTNDRLSAVPSPGMVRDPIDQMSTSNSIDFDKEETRSNKRASSIGATFRRLFSKSPAPHGRFSSETKTSESVSGAGHRGRTPPKTTNSHQISTDSIESSTLLPNNPYFAQQKCNEPISSNIWGG